MQCIVYKGKLLLTLSASLLAWQGNVPKTRPIAVRASFVSRHLALKQIVYWEWEIGVS